jgi:DNA-binding GntR family transcriptional regulator
MVPDRLWLDRRLNATDVRIWCVLAFLARARDHTDATDAAIGDQVGLSARTVRDSLRRLESCGFVGRDRQGEARIITLRPEGDGNPVPELGLRVFG